MDNNKTQESKKTVVAFVAGLLIGGLLVWVFSAGQESSTADKVSKSETKTAASSEAPATTTAQKTEDVKVVKEADQGAFTFNVANQPAGAIVTLGSDVKYPTKEGWIVVHEDAGGELGRALGASRYNTEVGLTPDSIDLLRNTEKGKTYHVVYYTEDGDRMFDLKMDTPMQKDGGGLIKAMFVAE